MPDWRRRDCILLAPIRLYVRDTRRAKPGEKRNQKGARRRPWQVLNCRRGWQCMSLGCRKGA
jgi:hypothetical protein